MRRALFLTVAFSVMTAWPASAQGLKIEFHDDGRVTVDANATPVRSILTEWGKIGGTKIVGAERISGAPLTLKLINVPEAKALETILRSVAGYMAAPRHAGAGASMYDRIMVLAVSAAPAPAAASNTARPTPQQPNAAFNGTQRFVPPQRQQRPEEPEREEPEEPDENPPSPPVFTFPQPGQMPNQAGPGQFVNTPNNGQPVTITVNPSNGQPANININGAPASPAQPTGPVGVSQPGMMVNPPAANQPNQPGMIRRPGGSRQ
jgi:hypothetical protein